ncbi:MAG: SPOR domain-containing protein [Carboxylicivirga sp.]|nr:SPOR domain-containing protein [Carboxylicivirga sp.]
MENYILSLIKENNRVIVPNFGAFIVAKENGFSVLFNNFLSFNDGLLVDYITQKDGVSREEAEKQIEEYVERVKATLDEKGTYHFPNLGTFTKDATGILRFEQSEALKDAGSISTEPTELDEGDSLLDIDSSGPIEENTDVADVSIPDSTLNESTPIAEVEEDKPIVEETPQQPVSQPVFEKEIEKDEVIEEDLLKDEPDSVSIANKYLEEDNSKRNRSVAIFLLVILVPLIGFIVYFFFFKDNLPADTQQKLNNELVSKEESQKIAVETTEPEGQIDAGPSIEESAPVEEELVKPVEPEPKPVINKPHQLIVGSFASETNANRMVDKLKKKGYEQAFVFFHNNRHMVSLESFDRVSKAQTRQEEILNSDRMESWILTKR